MSPTSAQLRRRAIGVHESGGAGGGLEFLGEPSDVTLRDGRVVRHINLEWAATTPALVQAKAAVDELLPHYGSAHRGAGPKSRITTEALEHARDRVATFVGARSDDVVVFTKNTTDALNLLASCLPPETSVVTFDADHHANLLAWRGRSRHVCHLPTPAARDDAAEVLDRALATVYATVGQTLVALTAVANVTGEHWPIEDLVAVARGRGARVALDAAQLVGHAPLNMEHLDVDYVALSGHKMYAPFGVGALIGRRDWLEAAEPAIKGGGAVRWVTVDDVSWVPSPARHEAGTPNILGAAALGAACEALGRYGTPRIIEHERHLGALFTNGLAESGVGIQTYQLWSRCPSATGGTVTFNVDGKHHTAVAERLAVDHGISVRSGCLCAHPAVIRLLRLDETETRTMRGQLDAGVDDAHLPGVVRVSFGPANDVADVERAVHALAAIARGSS